MTWEERRRAVELMGFTERQAGFLVTVMLHAGVIAHSDVDLSYRLADQLSIRAGDNITLVSPRGANTVFGTTPRIKVYKVAAVFEIEPREEAPLLHRVVGDLGPVLVGAEDQVPDHGGGHREYGLGGVADLDLPHQCIPLESVRIAQSHCRDGRRGPRAGPGCAGPGKAGSFFLPGLTAPSERFFPPARFGPSRSYGSDGSHRGRDRACCHSAHQHYPGCCSARRNGSGVRSQYSILETR